MNIKCCTHIRQVTSDWCLQACLESFLADNNVRRTQREMVELGIQRKFCAESGVIPYDRGKEPEHRNMIEFCALFDIDLEKMEDRRIPQKIRNGEGVLIAPWNFKKTGGHHCVRFCEFLNKKTFRVMDPAPDPDEFPECLELLGIFVLDRSLAAI